MGANTQVRRVASWAEEAGLQPFVFCPGYVSDRKTPGRLKKKSASSAFLEVLGFCGCGGGGAVVLMWLEFRRQVSKVGVRYMCGFPSLVAEEVLGPDP